MRISIYSERNECQVWWRNFRNVVLPGPSNGLGYSEYMDLYATARAAKLAEYGATYHSQHINFMNPAMGTVFLLRWV
jgi:hypothetical protein